MMKRTCALLLVDVCYMEGHAVFFVPPVPSKHVIFHRIRITIKQHLEGAAHCGLKADWTDCEAG